MSSGSPRQNHYHFLSGLLRQKRLSNEDIESILNHYVSDRVAFESGFYSMQKSLMFGGLRVQDANHIALAFHQQLRSGPIVPPDLMAVPPEELSIRDLFRLKVEMEKSKWMLRLLG